MASLGLNIAGEHFEAAASGNGPDVYKRQEDAEMVFALEISHIGYHNNRVRLDKEHLSDLKIYLTPPVSYTHLDVYKRQLYGLQFPICLQLLVNPVHYIGA